MRQLLNTFLKKEQPQLLRNRKFLLERRQTQLKLVEKLKQKTDNTLLNKNISELVKLDKQQVFNTFVSRTLNPKFRSLNSLADVNNQRALKKNPKGVPFTVKDHLKVDGMIQTCGFSKNIGQATDCTEVVQLLEKQGCVAYAHTNVPQGLLGIESSNRVYGQTKNPFNPKCVAGGSSGGQGPQVATQASVFSVCSDSAGSVRIPAAFCGVYGFKPTGSKRLSTKGRVGVTGKQGPSMPGLDTSLGFLTRNVEDLEWLCEKTLGKTIDNNPYVFGEWNKQLFEISKVSKKRFGVISSTHEIDLAPAVKNVLNQTIQLLRKQGHQVVQFDFPQLYQFRNFFFKILNNFGFMNTMRDRIQGEFAMPQNQSLLNQFYSTPLGRKLRVYSAQSDLEKEKFKMHDIGQTSLETIMLLKDKEFWQHLFYQQWAKSKVDLLITPTMPFTAPYHGQTENAIHQLTFTAFQNVLELPAGHVPVRLVQPNETEYDDTRLYGSQVRKSIQKSEGLPVGVQITGEFMKDEVVIGAMWQLQQAMGRKIHLPKLD